MNRFPCQWLDDIRREYPYSCPREEYVSLALPVAVDIRIENPHSCILDQYVSLSLPVAGGYLYRISL